MIDLKHISASSITTYLECPRAYAYRYDSDLKRPLQSRPADKGTLVHSALEKWKKPGAMDQTLENLLKCFDETCVKLMLGETMQMYIEGRKLCEKAYDLTISHPYLPLNQTKIWMTEAEILWKPTPDFPLPMKGFIDTVELITDRNNPLEITLVIGDYKTGKPKSREDLLEDLQPPIYMAYAVHVLKPHLESLGFTVKRVANMWTYIASGLCIPLWQEDYDLDEVLLYVKTISQEMLNFVNTLNSLPQEKKGEYLQKRAKTHMYCNWCPVRKDCELTNRVFLQHQEIDISAPGFSIGKIVSERDFYAAAALQGETRRKEIDRFLRIYLEKYDLPHIEYDNKMYFEQRNTNKVYPNAAIAEMFGPDFFVENGTVSKEKVQLKLGAMKLLNPARYAAVSSFLTEKEVVTPGAVFITSKKLSRSSRKKETSAS